MHPGCRQTGGFRKAMVAAHRQGHAYAQIAALLGIGEATVSRVLRRQREAGTRESLVQHVGSLQARLPFKKIAAWFRHCIPLGQVNRSLLWPFSAPNVHLQIYL
jgi:Winged helix-turn helix